ncbi:MAG: hypothetical protein ACE5PV_20465 [Candidatus Poribacteria bacterium]
MQQSVHSDYLRRQAMENHLTLAIPEYAFAEVDGGLQRRLSEQKHQLQGMNAFANELLRRRDTQQQARFLKEILPTIQETLQTTLDTLKAQLADTMQVCEVIPLNFEIFRRGRLRSLSSSPPEDETDCYIFESVLAFLREHEKEYDLKLFLCHDQKHFDEPTIHHELTALSAKLVFSSAECIQTIRAYLPEK